MQEKYRKSNAFVIFMCGIYVYYIKEAITY